MKRFIELMLSLPVLLLVSCSDSETAEVKVSLEYENAVVVNSAIYVVRPNVFKVSSVTVAAINPAHKASNGAVSYWFAGQFVTTNPIAPFGAEFTTEQLPVGRYMLEVSMPIFEEGCAMTTAAISVPVTVVESADDIPADKERSSRQDDVAYSLS